MHTSCNKQHKKILHQMEGQDSSQYNKCSMYIIIIIIIVTMTGQCALVTKYVTLHSIMNHFAYNTI